MSARVLKARKQSAAQFIKRFSSTIQDFDFEVGSLVLVCNSHIEKELNHKTKPHFLGPMVIVHCTKGGAYILAELNGAISRLQYAAFQIIPYLARFPDHIPVTSLLDDAELGDIQLRSESFPPADELPNNPLFDDLFHPATHHFFQLIFIAPQHLFPKSNQLIISADHISQFLFVLVCSFC